MIDHSINRGYSLSDVERAYSEGWADAIDEFINQIESSLLFYCGKDSNLRRIAEQLKEQNK